MEGGGREFTFIWSIENYSYCWHQNGEALISPDFTSKGLLGSTWVLELCPRGLRDEDRGYVSLFINRSGRDPEGERMWVLFELLVLAEDGSPLHSLQLDKWFGKGHRCGFEKFLKMDEIFLRKKADYLPHDTLTVCCKIWCGDSPIAWRGSARTRIKVERISFLHVVENFSRQKMEEKKTIYIRPCSKDKPFISSSLRFTDCSCCEKKMVVEILPCDTKQILHRCELYLLDVAGNAIECGRADILRDTEGKNINSLTLSTSRKVVLNKKSEFLPNDKFSLLCKCTFSAGLEFQTIEEIVHEMPSAVLQKCIDAPTKSGRKVSEKASKLPGGLEDIKALYNDNSFTDVELKTRTKSFPAHKIVLCARSAVFRAMLTSDMREKNTSCVEIDDLDDNIVKQLLHFLYSDAIENMEWTMATRLYYAADKYEVDQLKEVCSSFLVENLTPANAGSLLLLADTHGDAHLKQVVEDFILGNEEEVFCSDEWERLMETNSLLFMKVMHLKYKRRKLE